MKKVFVGISNVFLSILIFLLLFSFYGKTIYSGFVIDFLGGLSTNINDTSFGKENNDEDDEIIVGRSFTLSELLSSPKYKKILKSKELRKLVDKYIDSTIIGVTNPNSLTDVDLAEDIINFIIENKKSLEKEYGIKISDDDITRMREKEEFKSLTENYIENIKLTSENLSKTQKNMIKLFYFVCGTAFKIIVSVLIFIDLIIISIALKSIYKCIYSIGINLISSGVLTIILGLILHFSINVLVEKLKLGLKFDFLKISLVGFIAMVAGVVLMLICLIIKKKVENKDLEEVYDGDPTGFNGKFDTFDYLSPDDQ